MALHLSTLEIWQLLTYQQEPLGPQAVPWAIPRTKSKAGKAAFCVYASSRWNTAWQSESVKKCSLNTYKKPAFLFTTTFN